MKTLELKAWRLARHAPALGVLVAAILPLAFAQPALADGPGRGATASFEKAYLTLIIDHHYSALRMSELAAGTDRTRDATVNNPAEGTSPSPEFGNASAKSSDPHIRSMAREANRVQREEIARAQDFLRDWYGVRHDPVLTPDARKMLVMLENAPAGAQFDQAFLRTFSNHHFSALAPSVHCQVTSDLQHDSLRRYCENIVVTQKNEINEMREMLCKRFNECGFVPMASTKPREFD